MNNIKVKPEKEQLYLFILTWFIWLIIGFVSCVLFLFSEVIIGFVISISVLCIIMVLVLIWIKAFYNSLEYIIANDSIKMKKGVFWREQVTVPYLKITNIDVTQGPVQRLFNIGTIRVQTAGAGGAQGAHAELKLLGVRDLDRLKDAIMERVIACASLKSEEVKKQIVNESDSEILRRILKELTTIRDVLEKKSS